MKLKVGDKFTDLNSVNKNEVFTVTKLDGNCTYDEYGWYRLTKNCKKLT